MKTKSKVLLSALLVIALCVSLIAGTTFALFSSEDNVNITVSSGKVSVKATVGEITKSTSIDGKEPVVEATVVGGKVTLDKMVPGDRVSFPISVSNEGTTVKAAYSVAYEVTDGYLLADGLDIKIEYVGKDNATVDITNGGSYKSYSSAWNDDVASVYNVTIELPNHADSKIDNLYQGLSTSINFAVNAVQANGVTIGGEAVTEALPDYTAIKEAYINGENVVVTNDIMTMIASKSSSNRLTFKKGIYVLTGDVSTPQDTTRFRSLGGDVTIDLNGYSFICNGTSVNPEFVMGQNANLTIKNGTLKSAAKGGYDYASKTWLKKSVIEAGHGNTLTLKGVNIDSNGTPVVVMYDDVTKAVIEDCTINGHGGAYAISTNAENPDVNHVVMKNTIVKNVETGILYNVGGTLTVDGCDIQAINQGIIARGGTVNISNSSISVSATEDAFADKDWGSGTNVSYGALVVGNKNNDSYEYETNLELNNVTLEAGGNVAALYVWGHKNIDYPTEINYQNVNVKGNAFVHGNKVTLDGTPIVDGGNN